MDSISNDEYDSAIYSVDSILFSGSGKLNIVSTMKGIYSKNIIVFRDGNYVIDCNDDGIKGVNGIAIINGNFDIKTLSDGLKTSNDNNSDLGYIIIDNGNFNIKADGDCLESNNYLYFYNGIINAQSAEGYKKVKNDKSAKGIKAVNNIVLVNGEFVLNCMDDAIHSNGDIAIYNGNINIKTGDDGIHADNNIYINDGNIDISYSYEGIEGKNITINRGNYNIVSNDDGINGTGNKKIVDDDKLIGDGSVIINDGIIKVSTKSDGIDCNGSIIINGGKIYLEGANLGPNSALDYYHLEINGGTLFAIGGIGADDKGDIDAKQPVIFVTLSKFYDGEINIGKLSYIPSIKYKSIIISSSLLLSNKEYVFRIGENTKKIRINDKVTKIEKFM